jgi:hypothetical protein
MRRGINMVDEHARDSACDFYLEESFNALTTQQDLYAFSSA